MADFNWSAMFGFLAVISLVWLKIIGARLNKGRKVGEGEVILAMVGCVVFGTLCFLFWERQ